MSPAVADQTVTLATNLKCGSCLAKLKPVLDEDRRILSWDADLSDPQRPVRARLATDASPEVLSEAIARAGFQARPVEPSAGKGDLGSLPVVLASESTSPQRPAPALDDKPPFRLATYKPLLLVLAYVVGASALFTAADPVWSWMAAMNNFMGFFFLGFAFFKLLDIGKFADAFASYDVIAKRSRSYGLAYPWIELGLGLAYLLAILPVLTNLVTAVIMGVGLIGVVQAVRRKQAIQCACLGTAFNLPMSAVTIIENSVMMAMAIVMLGWLSAGTP